MNDAVAKIVEALGELSEEQRRALGRPGGPQGWPREWAYPGPDNAAGVAGTRNWEVAEAQQGKNCLVCAPRAQTARRGGADPHN